MVLLLSLLLLESAVEILIFFGAACLPVSSLFLAASASASASFSDGWVWVRARFLLVGGYFACGGVVVGLVVSLVALEDLRG